MLNDLQLKKQNNNPFAAKIINRVLLTNNIHKKQLWRVFSKAVFYGY